MIVPNAEITWIEDDVCVCNNCGAHADSPENIKHFDTCQAGDAEKWEKFYKEAGEMEQAWYEEYYNTEIE
jgi:hypothetical protein